MRFSKFIINTYNNMISRDIYISRAFFLFLLLFLLSSLSAQEVLTLDQCRQRAIDANKGLKQADEKRTETKNLQKSAFWQMMPKVSANGGYTWMEKTVNLLSDEQKERINTIGNTVQDKIDAAIRDRTSTLPLGGEFIGDYLTGIVNSSELSSTLNDFGREITTGFETDTRNVFFGVATVTQPVYMGGKLLALYKSARLLNHLSNVEYDSGNSEPLPSKLMYD